MVHLGNFQWEHFYRVGGCGFRGEVPSLGPLYFLCFMMRPWHVNFLHWLCVWYTIPGCPCWAQAWFCCVPSLDAFRSNVRSLWVTPLGVECRFWGGDSRGWQARHWALWRRAQAPLQRCFKFRSPLVWFITDSGLNVLHVVPEISSSDRC